MNLVDENGLIRFPNLCQYADTTTVGEYTDVKAKAVAFTSVNAKGVLREVNSIEDIRLAASEESLQFKEWAKELT